MSCTDVLIPVSDVDAVYLEGKKILEDSGVPGGTTGEAMVSVLKRAHRNVQRRRSWYRRFLR